jgi:hypothetical protein
MATGSSIGFLITLMSFFWVTTPAARAQSVGGGQIQGLVTDSTGAVVPGATVDAEQTESGLRREVTSGPDGGYIFPNLPVGPYQLSASKTGFNSYRQSGIVIQVGNNLRIDLVLKVGGATETVQVQSDASMVQTEDQAVSQVIDKQRVTDLPLNGRQATQLILLSGAATVAPNGDNVGSKNYPSEVTLSVAGSQGTQTEYLMDGADNTDSFSNVNLPFPFPDALQEFSVQTSGLAAQYGFHPGSVVNIVTRTGANAFHGTVFDFLRNNYFNATSYFSNKDTLKRNQFGGVIGGPIRHDKIFFFGGYQGTIVHQQSNNTKYIIPTTILNGDWTAYAATNKKTQNHSSTPPSARQPTTRRHCSLSNNISPRRPTPAVPISLVRPIPIQSIRSSVALTGTRAQIRICSFATTSPTTSSPGSSTTTC